MMRSLATRYKQVIYYGLAMAALLLLMQWLQWRFVIMDNAIEIYGGAIALVFTGLGIWLATRLSKPKINTVIVEKEIVREIEVPVPAPFPGAAPLNQKEIERSGLSQRELEVLQLMAEGFSNQEIASRLFLSLSTIKTHASAIFEKLDVKRRTQAIEKAIRLRIIQASIPATTHA
ncbi:MAG: response regulator transcription factor [Chitinophagaceae bacterium]